MDRLSALLHRFSVSAELFHSGALCGVNDLPLLPDAGQLHLIKRGEVDVVHGPRRGQRRTVEGPTLIFYPRPKAHRFITDAARGADMACAHVRFVAARINPLASALPEMVVLPLSELGEAASLLDLLFAEAFAQRCGRQRVVDRLFEVVIVYLLRHLMNTGAVEHGLLAGMAHPRLAKALVAMHESPQSPWTLESLGERAGMSRSHFAACFHEAVGATPGDYLARYRICVAQTLLREGQALKFVAGAVGYGSTAALSRAFSALCGQSPRAWLAQASA